MGCAQATPAKATVEHALTPRQTTSLTLLDLGFTRASSEQKDAKLRALFRPEKLRAPTICLDPAESTATIQEDAMPVHQASCSTSAMSKPNGTPHSKARRRVRVDAPLETEASESGPGHHRLRSRAAQLGPHPSEMLNCRRPDHAAVSHTDTAERAFMASNLAASCRSSCVTKGCATVAPPSKSPKHVSVMDKAEIVTPSPCTDSDDTGLRPELERLQEIMQKHQSVKVSDEAEELGEEADKKELWHHLKDFGSVKTHDFKKGGEPKSVASLFPWLQPAARSCS